MFLVPVTRASTDLSRGLDRLFDDTFERFFGLTGSGEHTGRSPALDVSETDTAYTVLMDLPGVTKDAVKIAIDGRRVTVDAQVLRQDEKKEGQRLLYRERSQTQFSRSFTLPADIDQAESQAKLEHGTLTLTLVKRRAPSASHLMVN